MDPHGRNLETVGRLAAGIAHEINTPTQFVGDTVGFLRRCLRRPDRPRGGPARAARGRRGAARHAGAARAGPRGRGGRRRRVPARWRPTRVRARRAGARPRRRGRRRDARARAPGRGREGARRPQRGAADDARRRHERLQVRRRRHDRPRRAAAGGLPRCRSAARVPQPDRQRRTGDRALRRARHDPHPLAREPRPRPDHGRRHRPRHPEPTWPVASSTGAAWRSRARSSSSATPGR